MKQRKYWNENELELFKMLYPNTLNTELAEIFNCTLKQIYNLNKRLLCKKTDEYLKTNVYKIPITEKSIAHRFKKGHSPWTAGKKGIRMAPQTEFKKGNIPHNRKPNGHESKRDSYWFIKVNGKYILKHRYIWEQNFGKIPDNMYVKFLDNDRNNLKIENLYLSSKEDHALKNSIHNYPKEITEVMRLTKKIEKYAKK